MKMHYEPEVEDFEQVTLKEKLDKEGSALRTHNEEQFAQNKALRRLKWDKHLRDLLGEEKAWIERQLADPSTKAYKWAKEKAAAEMTARVTQAPPTGQSGRTNSPPAVAGSAHDTTALSEAD
jgi:hypothetical protein